MTNVQNDVKIPLTSKKTINYDVPHLFDVRGTSKLKSLGAFWIPVVNISSKVPTAQVTWRNFGEQTDWPDYIGSRDSRGTGDINYRPKRQLIYQIKIFRARLSVTTVN